MRYGYDPGCSRPPAGGSCDAPIRAVARALAMTLEEVEEPFGCTGGPSPMNGIAAYARVARMAALARLRLGPGGAGSGPDVVTPCGACFRSLSRAIESLGSRPGLRETVAEEIAAAGLPPEGGPVRVRHLLDVLWEDAGREALRDHVTRPLAGLRVAPYYGCLRAGPGLPGAEGMRPTPPARLEDLLSLLGADVVGLPLAEHCCGGRAAEASEEIATSLQHRILRSASERGADVIAVVCPHCRRHLAGGQDAVNRRFGTRFAIPVRYFADLVAEAFGLGPASTTASEG